MKFCSQAGQRNWDTHKATDCQWEQWTLVQTYMAAWLSQYYKKTVCWIKMPSLRYLESMRGSY